MSEECCDELSSNQQQTNALLEKMLQLWQDGFKLVPINSGLPPDELAGGCAPPKYDEDGSDTGDQIALRKAALCYVVYCYILTILVKGLVQMGLPLPALELLFPILASSPTALQKLTVMFPSVLTIAALIQNIATSGADIDIVVCQMVDSLSDELNTFDVFRKSVPTTENEALLLPISSLVNATNQKKDNWTVFNEALIQAMDMPTEVNAYECPCSPPVPNCDEPLDLVIHVGDGSSAGQVITPLGDDLYRFEQTNLDGSGRSTITVKDALGRCIKFEGDVDTQAVFDYNITGCIGAEGDCESSDISGAGGFAPQNGLIFGWHTSGAADTVYKVTCCVPTP